MSFVTITPTCVTKVDWTSGVAISSHPLEVGSIITVDLWQQGARDFLVDRVHDDGRTHDVVPVSPL